jgi:cation diffusion facilitator CzcD-associated flavoprotein CzcO
VLLLDAGKSIGGTWSAERLYPGLQSNNVAGFLEFSDFPMDFDTYQITPQSHIPGDVIHRYLNAYVDHFGFRDRIRLGATVESAELRDNDSWLVRYEIAAQSNGKAQQQTLVAKKLVLATGTTSTPNMPTFSGSDKFGGDIFHSMELGNRTGDLEAAENILVVGGSKSAADAVYMNASKGKHVNWIIRGKLTSPQPILQFP